MCIVKLKIISGTAGNWRGEEETQSSEIGSGEEETAGGVEEVEEDPGRHPMLAVLRHFLRFEALPKWAFYLQQSYPQIRARDSSLESEI